MTLKTRLAKLESTIDPNVCPVCGQPKVGVDVLRYLAANKRAELLCRGWEGEQVDRLIAEVYPEVAPLMQ